MSKSSGAPTKPTPLSARSAWARGPPQSETAPSPRSQSPAPSTPVSQTHSCRPSALGQGFPTRDGVRIPQNNEGPVKQGSQVTFGSIDDTSSPISLSPAVASMSSSTSLLPAQVAPSSSSPPTPVASVPAPTASAPLRTKIDIRKMFQPPFPEISNPPSDTSSPSLRNSTLPSQQQPKQSPYPPPPQLGAHCYIPFVPSRSMRQQQGGGPNGGPPRSPQLHRAMQNGNGGPPGGMPSPRLGPHPHNGQNVMPNSGPPPPQPVHPHMQPQMPWQFHYAEQPQQPYYPPYYYPYMQMQPPPPPPMGGVSLPPPTPSSALPPANRLDSSSSAFVPSTRKVSLIKQDGTMVDLGNLSKSSPHPPLNNATSSASPQGSIYERNSPGTPNNGRASVRIESEDQHRSRLEEEAKEKEKARSKIEAEDKGKEEAARNAKEDEEERKHIGEAEKGRAKKGKRGRKERERLRKEEQERLNEEAEAHEAQGLKEEAEREIKEAEHEVKWIAEEKARLERLWKEKGGQGRLAKEADTGRLRLEKEIDRKAKLHAEAAAAALSSPVIVPSADLDGKTDKQEGGEIEDGKEAETLKEEAKDRLRDNLLISTAAARRTLGLLDLSGAKNTNISAPPLSVLGTLRAINDSATQWKPPKPQNRNQDKSEMSSDAAPAYNLGAGSLATSMQAAIIPTPQQKIQQLKDELHNTQSQLGEAREHLEAYVRELKRTRGENRQMADHIINLEQRLKEANESRENELPAVLSGLHDLASIDGKESVDAQTQVLLTKADTLSVSEVIEKVANLNEDIFQAAASLGETLIHKPHNVSQEEMNFALGIAQWMIGDKLINILREESRKEVPKANPLIVQVVLQVFLVTYCSQLVQTWSNDTTCASYLAAIYSRIHDEEDQAVSGRWRSLTRRYTRPTPEGWKEDLLRNLGSVLRTAAWTTPSAEEHAFEEKLETIFCAIEDLRSALGEKFTSADLEVSVMPPDLVFRPNYMEDAYGGPDVKYAPREVVAGTTGMGLKKPMPQRSATGEVVYENVLAPKVALQSTLLEALQLPPPPRTTRNKRLT